jgi:hypothetical protein
VDDLIPHLSSSKIRHLGDNNNKTYFFQRQASECIIHHTTQYTRGKLTATSSITDKCKREKLG